MRPLKDVVWGIGWGLAFATSAALIASVIYLIRGSRPFATNGTTLLAVLVMYFLAGVVGGGIVGLLRPLTQQKAGAAVVGFVAMLPVWSVVIGTLEGFTGWGKREAFAIILGALLAGPATGVKLWGAFHEDSPEPH